MKFYKEMLKSKCEGYFEIIIVRKIRNGSVKQDANSKVKRDLENKSVVLT